MNPFFLLMWKNWKLQSRKPVLTVFEIGFPVFFGLILLLIRQIVDSTKYDSPREWDPFTINRLPEADSFTKQLLERVGMMAPERKLAYTPDKPVIERIVTTVAERLNLSVNGNGFPNEGSMVEYLMGENGTTAVAGVVFDLDSIFNDTALSNDLSYKLRFPARLRTEDDEWYTEIMFPAFALPGPRADKQKTGGIPKYYEEGFLSLQHAINIALIKEIKDSAEGEIDNMKIQMRRFPYPPYVDDNFILVLQRQLPFLILLSFIVTAPNIVKDIIIEKENRLKEFMKMMGLTSALHWFAWFLKYLIFLLIAVILLTIFFKVDAGKGAIINASGGLVIFVFLLLYSIATIMFCFAISTCFSKSNSGSAAGGILFFVNYMPYFFLVNTYSTLGTNTKVQCCLLHNVAMAFGCQIIAAYEGQGSGIQWSNLGKPVNVDDNFTMGIVFVMLIFDCFLYWFIMFYVDNVWPGEYGIPQPWYFLFTKSYWCGGSKVHEIEVEADAPPVGEFFEEPPTNVKPGIRIKNLKKVFKRGKEKKVAVAGTHLDMYEGQITALLGHNGAGKTTTMSMLTGFIPPTSGTATINGYDIRTEIVQVRQSLGMCPQHDVLFDTLTVEEHLYFYGQLKGIPSKEIYAEIDQMLIVLHLEAKRKAYAKSLSGGMKRKLSVGIALLGGSKIVILDEPTSGMDPEARRQMWDILQSQRKDRTMVLSTHFMDEADLLGDRIAIMAEGVVQCAGSSLFLKGKYGVGYHMIMVKEPHCDVMNMTSIIQRFVPTAQLESNISAELSYLLPRESSGQFEALFTYLEQNRTDLGISSFGASVTTMEEVFLRVGESANEDVAEKLQSNGEQMNGFNNPAYVHENGRNGADQATLHISSENAQGNLFGGSLQKNTGLQLSGQQFYGMFIKRVIHSYRNWVLTLSQLLVPMFFTLMACLIDTTIPAAEDSPSRKLTMSEFSVGQNALFSVDVENYTGHTSNLATAYANFLDDKAAVKNVTDVSGYIVDRAKESLDSYGREYMVAATFEGTDPSAHNQSLIATVLFNNQPYHAISISLSVMGNALLRLFGGDAYSITAYNHPLPRMEENRIEDEILTAGATAFTVAIMMIFGMSFLVATFVVFLIKERQTSSKHIQFVSGVHTVNYWFSTFVWDFLNFMIPTVVIIIILSAFQVEAYTADNNVGYVFLLFVLYAWSVLPSTYILSWLFTQPASGYAWSVVIFFALGIGSLLAVVILAIPGLGTQSVSDLLRWLFYLFVPHFSFGYGLTLISSNYQNSKSCGSIPSLQLDILCLRAKVENGSNPCCPDQCGDFCAPYYSNYLEWQWPGLGPPVTFMAVQGVAFFILLYFFESGVPGVIWQKILESTNDDSDDNETVKIGSGHLDDMVQVDSDVMAERDRINNTDKHTLIKENSLVLKNLQKYYGNFLAVDGLCVGIPQGECFGLLGVNGAGKTTTFKMMTGDHPISSGEAYLDTYSVIKEIKKVQQRLGYCPQFDALIEQMTVVETLTMYARLRGIQESQIQTVIKSLMDGLLLSDFANKLAGNLSGGNKRKLSTAIALIGDPPIIFLDEPTTGMDPMARRLLWDTLTKVRQAGKTLILTSHSMEECEALCTRLAIMVNGHFKCLGATQHLKSKFGEGYTLIVKVKQDENIEDKTQRLMQFIERTFSEAVIKDQHQGLVHYQINDKDLSWAKIFGIMERVKVEYDMEDYSVSQTTLEQVFISFARKQKPPKESRMGAFRKMGNCCKFFCCCKYLNSTKPGHNRQNMTTSL